MPATVITQIAPAIYIGGTPMKAPWTNSLTYLRVERGLNIVGRTTLRFIDVGYGLSTSTIFELGTTVSIEVADKPVFSGVVTGASLDHQSDQAPELVVTIDDPAIKLGFVTKSVAWETKSYSDIISAMATGMSADVTTDTSPNDYVLQNGTDLAFLDTLARRTNSVWWVDEKTLKVKPAGGSEGSADVALDKDLLDFSVRASGLRPVKVTVNGWDPANQTEFANDGSPNGKTASSDFVDDYLGDKPGSSLGLKAAVIAGEGNPGLSGEADLLAKSLATMLHSEAVVARGTSIVNADIKPYVKLNVAKAGPSSGSYTVSEVEHVYSKRGFFTKFVAGPVRTNGLVDTLGPDGPDTGFLMPHLTTGIVDNIQDEKNMGRVRVKYTGAGGKLVSAWARVLSFGGGAARGSYFLPEVKDEVLVGFERGDSRHPVVLGGLFSSSAAIAGDDKAVGGDGKVAYRRVTSREGHMIELSDGPSPDKEHILLQLGTAKHKLRLGADKMEIELEDGKPFSLKAGQAKIEIDNQGNISIEGMSISVKGKQDIKLEAQMSFEAKGTTGLKLGGMTAELKGDTTATVEGSAQTAIKGGVVMIN